MADPLLDSLTGIDFTDESNLRHGSGIRPTPPASGRYCYCKGTVTAGPPGHRQLHAPQPRRALSAPAGAGWRSRIPASA